VLIRQASGDEGRRTDSPVEEFLGEFQESEITLTKVEIRIPKGYLMGVEVEKRRGYPIQSYFQHNRVREMLHGRVLTSGFSELFFEKTWLLLVAVAL